MAYRLHIIAARGATADEFQQSLRSILPQESGESPSCSPFRFGSNGDWQWASASVWHVDGHDIDGAIAKLPGVALRVTSSDGALWMLTVAGAGYELFRGVHFFTSVGCTDWDHVTPEAEEEEDPLFPRNLPDEVAGIDRDDPDLAFLWDEQEAAALEAQLQAEDASPKPWQDYLDYGVNLPDDALQQMETLPALAAQRIAFYAHAAQIADALAQRGVPFVRDALVQLLTVGPLTQLEQQSDLGNLPRFLAQLGIFCFEGGENALKSPGDDEERDPEPFDWSVCDGREAMDAVRSLVVGREPVPVAPGPVELKLSDVVHLLTISQFCDADDGPAMIVLHLPSENYQVPEIWARAGDRGIEFERCGARCSIAFSPTPYWLRIEDRGELARHPLIQALQSLPDGVAVEFIYTVAGTNDGCHRFCGEIHDGRFQLNAAYPALQASIVHEALDLLQLTLGKAAIPVDNPEEEQRMRAAYHDATGAKPRVRQGRMQAEGGRHAVVRCKFVTRFRDRGIWDVEGAERRRAEVAAEIDALLEGNGSDSDGSDSGESADPDATAEVAAAMARMQEFVEQAQRAKKVPRTNKLIYEGQVTRYFHAPMLALEGITAEEIAEQDRQMAEIGFRWVCDSASEKFGETISRSYAGVSNAIVMYERRLPANSHSFNSDGVLLDFSQGVHEFQTYFRDGSVLVTNDIDGASSNSRKKIFVRAYEGRSIRELWGKHLDGVARLAKSRSTAPVDHTQFQTPAAFAKVVDSLMHRFLS